MISEKMLVLAMRAQDTGWMEGRYRKGFEAREALEALCKAIEALEKENRKLKKAQTRFMKSHV